MDRNQIFSRLLETTREGYWLIDNQTVTLDLNPAMCEILGRSREAVMGRPIYDFVDDENRAVFEEQIRLRAHGHVGPYEVSLLRPNGSLVACMNNATPILDDGGDKIGSVGLWTDISDVKALIAELEESKTRAERASQAKSEFLSSMSHELRTPMNAMLGYAQLLEAGQGENALGARQGKHVERILEAGRHLLDLIDELLDLSRIDAGKLHFDIQPIEPSEVLEECHSLVRSLATAHDITLENPAGQSSGIFADRTRFRQILINLLSNAIKYNRTNGSVQVEFKTLDSGWLRTSVSDTGEGIAPDQRDGLFEAFNRLGRENSKVDGAGVGLALTKRLVEEMGGEIDYESELGKGSTFHVSFPLVPGDMWTARRARPGNDTTDMDPIGTVLYIEDNRANASFMSAVLEEFNHISLHIEENAEDGLRAIHQVCPDLILMDVNLPGMSGLEAVRKIRAQPEIASLPVVALSSAATRQNRADGETAGFDRYLTKPLDLRDLKGLLQHYLGNDVQT